MNRITKRITVRFFNIKADKDFYKNFVISYKSNQLNENNVRIINYREKKYFIKVYEESHVQENKAYFLSVVRERTTWQIRALGNGTISGIPLNQGIIGDPYYFVVVPDNQLVFGFTTGPSSSLKGVIGVTLNQFIKERNAKIDLEPIFINEKFQQLKEIETFFKLYFKVDTKALGGSHEYTPGLIKDICDAPFIKHDSQIALTFSEIGETGLTNTDLIEIVSYLAENDGCSALHVYGMDNTGSKVHFDFSQTFVFYKKNIEVKEKYIDENNAKKILQDALTFWIISRQ